MSLALPKERLDKAIADDKRLQKLRAVATRLDEKYESIRSRGKAHRKEYLAESKVLVIRLGVLSGRMSNVARAGFLAQNRIADLYFRIGYHTCRIENTLRRQLLAEQRKKLRRKTTAKELGFPV